MRTNLNLDDRLVARARLLSGIDQTGELVRAALEALVARESARRLAALGGSQSGLQCPPRRRPG
jgi:Arc/MetJ family transcription regulator